MSRLLEIVQSGRVLLLDGAMGSELLRAGLPAGTPCEAWNLSHPERVLAIHQAYVAAGADCLTTNTFLANPEHLARHGLEDQLGEIVTTAIGLARQAAGPERFVLASVGPLTGNQAQQLARIVPALAGADAILFETWSDVAIFEALGTSVRDHEALLSFAYRPAATPGAFELETGTAPAAVASAAPPSLAMLGVNCGRDIDVAATASIVRAYRATSRLPVLARPNAGTPVNVNGAWQYPLSPAELACQAPLLLQAGATLIGGCCGTTPEHISRLRPVIDDWNQSRV